MHDLTQQLRLEIKQQLQQCDGSATPQVCQAIQSAEGYQKVEGLIIGMVIHQQLTPAAAIAQIEMEWQ